MTETVVHCQPAYILHQQQYRESSLILEVMTRDLGRISLIAKGVRKTKSKTLGILRPFVHLSLSFLGRSELKTLTSAEMIGLPNELPGLALYCGFYVNELVGYFLHKDDPHPEVFEDYQTCLSALSLNQANEVALRIFELSLLENIGYGINLSDDLHHGMPISANKSYRFQKEDGLIEDREGPYSGRMLQAIAKRQFNSAEVLIVAKQLMRTAIDSHLQGKQLKSRSVINTIVKRL